MSPKKCAGLGGTTSAKPKSAKKSSWAAPAQGASKGSTSAAAGVRRWPPPCTKDLEGANGTSWRGGSRPRPRQERALPPALGTAMPSKRKLKWIRCKALGGEDREGDEEDVSLPTPAATGAGRAAVRGAAAEAARRLPSRIEERRDMVDSFGRLSAVASLLTGVSSCRSRGRGPHHT